MTVSDLTSKIVRRMSRTMSDDQFAQFYVASQIGHQEIGGVWHQIARLQGRAA